MANAGDEGDVPPLDCSKLKLMYSSCVKEWLRERWEKLDLKDGDKCTDAFQVNLPLSAFFLFDE